MYRHFYQNMMLTHYLDLYMNLWESVYVSMQNTNTYQINVNDAIAFDSGAINNHLITFWDYSYLTIQTTPKAVINESNWAFKNWWRYMLIESKSSTLICHLIVINICIVQIYDLFYLFWICVNTWRNLFETLTFQIIILCVYNNCNHWPIQLLC